MAGYPEDPSQQSTLPDQALHERPTQHSSAPASRRRGSAFPWLVVLALLAFMFGMLASPWFETRVRNKLPFFGTGQTTADEQHAEAARPDQPNTATALPAVPAAPAAPPAPDPAVVAAEVARAAVDKDTSERLSALEERFDTLDKRSNMAMANAARAEGMLLALAARRAVDTGQPLGVIEGMLRERFGGTQPQAVAALIAASQQPVTLAQLQAGLQALEPQLQHAARSSSWIQELRDGLSQLIIIRRESAPATTAVEQLRDARQRLLVGDVGGALWQVNRLPEEARSKASSWIVAARRFLAARQALDSLETVALLAPPPGQSEQIIPLPDAPPISSPETQPAT